MMRNCQWQQRGKVVHVECHPDHDGEWTHSVAESISKTGGFVCTNLRKADDIPAFSFDVEAPLAAFEIAIHEVFASDLSVRLMPTNARGEK